MNKYTSTAAPSTDCTTPCSGDEKQTCGGPWRIDVNVFSEPEELKTTTEGQRFDPVYTVAVSEHYQTVGLHENQLITSLAPASTATIVREILPTAMAEPQ
jgi:hypothetical protein